MSYPNGRKEINSDSNSSGGGAAINDPGLLMSPAPACDPTIPKYRGGAERSEYALPAALAAGGIPSIAVLDENAVYEHYMRRLNRVWMKRIKATRGKTGVDPNHQHGSPHFRKLHARPTSVPQFIREMDPVVNPRQRRSPCRGTDPKGSQVAGQVSTQARLRPKSAAPVLEGRRPSPAWAEVRDRNRAAIGPGPTSSTRPDDVGDVSESRHAIFMDEKIENLGRGAVVRLIGSLGMGRYAHRFRAFAVTGSDLVSCTEEDLIQIGVSFRPHRIRLMREIEQRKLRSNSRDTGRRLKSGVSVAETQATCESRPASATNRQDAPSNQHAPALEQDSPWTPPGRSELIVDSPSVPKARPNDNNRVDSSSANSSGDKEGHVKSEALVAEIQATCKPRPASTGSHQGAISNQPPPPSVSEQENSPWVSPGHAKLIVNPPPAQDACPADDNRADWSSTRSSGNRTGDAKTEALVAATQATCELRPASTGDRQNALSDQPPPPSASEQDSPWASSGHAELIVDPSPEECPANNRADPSSANGSGVTGGHAKSGELVADSQATFEPRPASETIHQNILSNQPPASASEKNSPRVCPGSTELMVDSPSVPNSCPADNRADSSSTRTACTACNNTTPPLRLPAQSAEVQPSTESAASRPRCTPPEVKSEEGGEGSKSTEVERSEPSRSGRKRSLKQEENEDAACPWKRQDDAKDSRPQSNHATGGATDTAPLVPSDVSPERRIKTPRLESILGVSGISAGDMKAELDDRESFLRVRVTDQLQQAGTMVGKALEVSWRNNVLSFSVTERDLATGRIQIELCGGGIGAKDLIASGTIPGNVTLQLICRLRTQSLDKAHSAKEHDRAVAFTRTEPSATVSNVAVEVRMFAKDGGGDVGVCTLNLKIIPDGDNESAREAPENADQEKTPAETMQQNKMETSAPPSASVAAVSPVVPERAASASAEAEMAKEVGEAAVAASNDEERERHLLILKEAARHIGAIEKACQFVRHQHELLGIPDVRKGGHLLPSQTGKAPHLAEVDARKVVDAGALPRRRCPSAADERDAVVVIQSQCRRRAARKFAKRRAKERKAANKASHARQREFLFKQRKNDAAVTLQRNARRRISVKAVQRRRDEREEARFFEPYSGPATAAANDDNPVSGFKNDLPPDSSRREDRATSKVQGTSRVYEGKPQAAQREANVLELRDTSLETQTTDLGGGQSERWESHSSEAGKLQNSARSYAAIKAVYYLQRGTEAESLRRESIAAEEVATEIKRKLNEAQMEEDESWESGSFEAARLQASARSYAAIKTVDYLRRASETESLRQASVVAGEKAAEVKRKPTESEMEAEGYDAASGIQRVARSKQANDRVAVLRQKRDADTLQTRQLELEQQIVAEQKAEGCIQPLEISRCEVERAATWRKQREIDVQRNLAVESVKRTVARQDAASCIQRVGRSRQARLRVTAARRERNAEAEYRQKEAEMEAERHRAALGIQQITRSKQASDRVAALRQKRDADILHTRQLELELELVAQREAAECIQRLARVHSAVERVAALRKQREIGTQRDLAVESAKKTALRENAASCIQRAGRSRQARLRVMAARRERDIEVKCKQEEAEMEAERHRAALGIQRVARSKQASDRVAMLREKRDADILRAQKLELEQEMIAQREAAECIQRLARIHSAVERVAALRKQREIDVQRDLAVESSKRTSTREDAVACIQRMARGRQARLRVAAARRERDIEIKRKLQEAEMEAERHRAALGIQRVARSKQANDHVAALRQKRDEDILRARKLELEQELIARREAAECIQRLARRHSAVERVAALRQQREIDIQRDLAVELARREDAAACIQQVARSRQAWRRVMVARRERDIEIKRKLQEAEMEAERHHAALVIQQMTRSKQASDCVAVLREKRNADILHTRQLELELELVSQREAAECIQRLARMHSAVERVASLRKQREKDIQRALAVESAKKTAIRENAALCIQRAGRSRQAQLRVTAARRERDIEIKRRQEEAEREAERHRAALGIQRVARSKQASDRVAMLREKRDADILRTRQLELEQELVSQREAAECIQRLARTHSAVERVASLRKQREKDIQRDLAVESAKKTAIRENAALCIQRAGRSRQAQLRVTAARRERDVEIKCRQEEAEREAKRHRAALGIQRVARSKQASDRVAMLREKRDADILRTRQLELEQELVSQREAAECIQRLARIHSAVERVASLRRQREIDIQRALAVESAKQTSTQEEAASCIQRVGRTRQARLRTTALRKHREIDTQREVEVAKAGRETPSRDRETVSIERSVKSRQADQKRDDVIREHREVDAQHSSSELESTSQASDSAADSVSTSKTSESVVEQEQEQDTKEKRGAEVDEEVGIGVREEGLQQKDLGLQEVAAENEPESISSMFARMMDTARKKSIAGVGGGYTGLETESALSPLPEQHAEKTAGNTKLEAIELSAESNHRVGDADNADKNGGEREGNETWEVLGVPDSKRAFDSSTSAAADADGNGLLGHGGGVEGVRQSSSSESSGWESESSGDSEEQQDTQDILPASDADRGGRTRRDRSASSGVVDQHGEDREDNVGVLVSSVEGISPVAPGGGVNDEAVEFREGGNLSVESVEIADATSFPPTEVTTLEVASFTGDNEPQWRDERSVNSASNGFAATGDDAAERKTHVAEPKRDDEEQDVTHRSGSDLPGSNEKSGDHVSGQFSAEEDVMEEWETHFDEETGRAYYYHTKSGVTSWDHPRGGTGEIEQTTTQTTDEMAEAHPEDDVQGVSSAQAVAKSPVLVAAATVTEIQPLEAEWALGVDSGRREAIPEQAQDESDARGEVHAQDVGDTVVGSEVDAATLGKDQSETATDVVESFLPTKEKDRRLEEVVQSSSAVAADGGGEARKEDVQWEEIVDPDSGHKYFYNPATRQSTWALPDGALAVAAANAAAAVAAAAAAAEAAATAEAG